MRVPSRIGHGLTFSPDGKQLATSSRGAVTIWNVADGAEVRTYKQEMEIINAVAFSPDGKLAACCGGYFNNSSTPLGTILRVWRLDDGEVLFSRRTSIRSATRAVAFSPDGRYVAGTDLDDDGIGVWDWQKGERVKFFDNTSGTPYEVRFTRSGNYLVAAQAGGVVLYDMATAKKAFSFGRDAGSASAVDIAPGGSLVVSANSDKTIRLWRVPEPVRATVPPRNP
jgi:WD40 repeat protein